MQLSWLSTASVLSPGRAAVRCRAVQRMGQCHFSHPVPPLSSNLLVLTPSPNCATVRELGAACTQHPSMLMSLHVLFRAAAAARQTAGGRGLEG